ncbi:hypothetical protein CGRA01v4_02563 [Colletotrichum graminicola]|nr:hypothetical protein CGRA01v4_02563 [Colletotrichum graminicola]
MPPYLLLLCSVISVIAHVVLLLHLLHISGSVTVTPATLSRPVEPVSDLPYSVTAGPLSESRPNRPPSLGVFKHGRSRSSRLVHSSQLLGCTRSLEHPTAPARPAS